MRLPDSAGLSVLWPRSRCPRCQTAIRPHDNLPVLGWLLCVADAGDATAQISPRYPAIEVATGLSFAAVYLFWVAIAPADVWEQTSAFGIILRLLIPWSLIGFAEVGRVRF